MNDDERLKQTFDKLREDDARRAPSFDAVRKKRARRRSPWAVVVPLASAAAAAAVFVVWCNVQPSAAPAVTVAAPAVAPLPGGPLGGETAPQALADDAPLDFLLDVPGLRGAPDFDTSLLRGSLR
jgi:hypothetical protein